MSEAKSFAAVCPLESEPRVSFALCLPFRSSIHCMTIHKDSAISDLRLLAERVVVSRTHFVFSSHRIVIPFVFREYRADFMNWRENDSFAIANQSRGSRVVSRTSVDDSGGRGSSLRRMRRLNSGDSDQSGSSQWDIANRRQRILVRYFCLTCVKYN